MRAHLIRVFGAASSLVDDAAQHGLGFGELALSAKLPGPAHRRLDLVITELCRFRKSGVGLLVPFERREGHCMIKGGNRVAGSVGQRTLGLARMPEQIQPDSQPCGQGGRRLCGRARLPLQGNKFLADFGEVRRGQQPLELLHIVERKGSGLVNQRLEVDRFGDLLRRHQL